MRGVRQLGWMIIAACSFRHGVSQPDGQDIDAPVRIDAATDAVTPARHVQSITAITDADAVMATFTQPIAAGNLLVGCFRSTYTPSVSDDVNGPWTQVSTTTGAMYIFYFENSAAAPSLTITMTAGASSALRIVADEFSGIAKTGALDQSSSSQTTQTAMTWTAPVTAAVPDGELVYAGVGNFNNGVVFTAGSTNGVMMTASGQASDGVDGVSMSEYALAAAAGPQNASASVAPSLGMAGVQATFRRP
jgi:hypothetical protein